MKTSGSALNFDSLSDVEFQRLYWGEWDDINDENHPRQCRECGRPLEKYGKHCSINGGVYGVGWYSIDHLISPDYNLCNKCFETENKWKKDRYAPKMD